VGIVDLRKQAALRLAAAGAEEGAYGTPMLHPESASGGEYMGEAGEGAAYGAPVASPKGSLGPARHFMRSEPHPSEGGPGGGVPGGVAMGHGEGREGRCAAHKGPWAPEGRGTGASWGVRRGPP